MSPLNIFKVTTLEKNHFLLDTCSAELRVPILAFSHHVFNCLQVQHGKSLNGVLMLTTSALMAEAAYMIGVVECFNNVSTVLIDYIHFRKTFTAIPLQKFH